MERCYIAKDIISPKKSCVCIIRTEDIEDEITNCSLNIPKWIDVKVTKCSSDTLRTELTCIN